MSHELPPKNPNAHGLHLTDDEYRNITKLLESETAILRARVYGSRQTGSRREKAPPEPLDIDIAIEVSAPDQSDAFSIFLDVRRRIVESAGSMVLQVEWLTYVTSQFYCDRQNGVLIFERDFG